MEFFDLMGHIRSIYVDKTEGDDLRGMLFRRIRHHLAVFERSQYASRKIQMVGNFQEVIDKIGVLGVEMTMDIDDAVGGPDGRGGRSC